MSKTPQPTAADKRRAAAWAPFTGSLPVKRPAPVPSVWTAPLPTTKGTSR